MISSYRLGDLIFLDLSRYEQKQILREHLNSIGSKFILEKQNNKDDTNIDIVTKIALEWAEKNAHLLPNDISESTLIHLRLGDVVAGNEWHEIPKRPLTINHIKTLIENDSNKKYVIGKCFFAETSSPNYNECIALSNEYLKNVIDATGAEHFDSGDADIDLCCALKSKLFIQGKGYFSKLIVDIRTKLNLPCICIEP